MKWGLVFAEDELIKCHTLIDKLILSKDKTPLHAKRASHLEEDVQDGMNQKITGLGTDAAPSSIDCQDMLEVIAYLIKCSDSLHKFIESPFILIDHALNLF